MSSALSTEIERFLRTGQGEFETLALRLFAYQYGLNNPYRNFCDAQGKTPANVQRWQDIPAVPIGAFKSAELCTFLVGRAAAVFHSSATTTGTPSRHFLKELAYYENSLKAPFATWVLKGDTGARPLMFILTPPPAEATHSSLAWMMDVVKRTWGAAESAYFIQRGRLDTQHLLRRLQNAVTAGQPVLLLGTTISFLTLFEALEKSATALRLPAGSRLMDTGGMKTQKRSITRPEFVAEAIRRLGVSESDCINEYGMCELSSQFYGAGSSSHLTGPAWVQTRAIDPLTGTDAISGSSGLLCHYDLANVDSVLAVQTEDLGVIDATGFTFHGRAPSAELKGCSLTAENAV